MAARVEEMEVFSGGRWFRYQIEYKDFSRNQIPEGQFQLFIDIIIYLWFVTGKRISTVNSQRDEVHVAKVSKTKKNSIVISPFKNYIPPTLGGLGKGK